MKTFFQNSNYLKNHGVILVIFLSLINLSNAQVIKFPDSWGKSGISILQETPSGMELNYSIVEFSFNDIEVSGSLMKSIQLPGVFLPNDEGAPDLPGTGRFIALPEGASVTFRLLSYRTEKFTDVEVAPAPRIPKDTENGPLDYAKDQNIYSKSLFYPEQVVRLSEPTEIRGVDAVILGITPFQYNPVTKELVVYRDLKVEVEFNGGTGIFGENRLRSRWFDPILRQTFLNYSSLPEIEYNSISNSETEDFEYLIICPNDPVFIAWADSIKRFRNLQGIVTGVVTTAEIGGNNATTIENYINNAYNSWAVPPVAVLLLGDYGTSGSTIHSPMWDNYCVSDHLYADVNGNDMADLILARMTAQNATHLQTMIGKFIGYETMPPTNPDYYDHPITAMGWQTERWFQLCSETINGFWEYALGKQPVRENAIYSGSPGGAWSSNQNTSMVVNYFGPNGLGYIPANTAHLTDWGGNATRINNDINSGAFMLQHRDHGSETGWGEPSYNSSSINGLNNEDLTFVFSVNCLTGKFNYGGEVFAEKFHRYQNGGALGIIAASEVSYSFVNDTYVWGLYDYMWPQFMPDMGPNEPEHILPAFGNAAGKYFLQSSSWPYNTSSKEVTYYLFHHHGDAFSTVYSEVPQMLTVNHDAALISGNTSFNITADQGALIGLTVDGEIIGVAEATGAPQSISIPFQMPGNDVIVTVTKQNYYRYESAVPVIPASGAFVVQNSFLINDPAGNANGLLDYGESVTLDLTVENVGVAEATNVTVSVNTSDQYITMTDTSENYGNIPASGTLSMPDGFAFELDPTVPDGHQISFTVHATDGANIWVSYFSITAHSPVLELGEITVSDPTGNNNGKFDPGETVNIVISVENTGSSEAMQVVGTLMSGDQFIVINSFNVNYGSIPAAGTLQQSFSVTSDAGTPQGHMADFQFDINAQLGIYGQGEFSLVIGQIPALIVDLDMNHNSAVHIQDCLNYNNIASELLTSFPAELNLYSSIFVCLGIYSSNHKLTAGEGQLLADYLNNGGMLYMEGGDTWYYDPSTPVHSMFNINPLADGTGDLGTIMGQSGCFTENMQFNYTGDNSWIDHISPIAPAVEIFKNSSPSYGCGVAYDAGVYKTIGVSFEFGGLSNNAMPSTKEFLIGKVVDFFGLGNIVPVELTSFKAGVENNKVKLTWETATETNNSGFDIERSEDNISFMKIASVEGKGTTTEKSTYEFTDESLTGKGTYYYRLVQIDYDGTTEYFDAIEVEFNAVPLEFSLSQNYPNPFNPSTKIKFGIPKEVTVKLKIYDALGQEVHTLVNRKMEPGYYEYEWNASLFSSGVYFYRIEAGKFVQVKKLMLIK